MSAAGKHPALATLRRLKLMNKGVVFKALSGFYYVDTPEGILECRARGKLRSGHMSPLVGDEVIIEPLGGGKGSLEEVLPRRNSFIRPAVANIDTLVIIASAVIPVTDPFLIDRMAAIAELKGCETVICVNKSDRNPGRELIDIYTQAGFKTISTSAVTGEGIAELKAEISGKTCAFTGNSGVGKSSLLNALEPNMLLQTGEVSQKLGRGKHTTRHVEMFRLACGSAAIDTPGFSAFDAEDVSLELKKRLPELFREFKPYINNCRFDDCAHIKEPGCALVEAVNEGRVGKSRHASYVRLREQLRELKEWNIKKI